MTRNTQRARLLGLLLESPGAWVPLPKISSCAAQYNARIYDLRRLNFRIENRTQKVNGVRHSWFRLVTGPTQPTRNALPDRTAQARAWLAVARGEDQRPRTLAPAGTPSFPEFGNLAKESYGVD